MQRFGIGKIAIILASCFVFSLSVLPAEAEERDWALSFYGGRFVSGDLGEAFRVASPFEDELFLATTLSKRVFTFRERLDFELEGQVVKHVRDQYHWEFNALFALRLHLLPPTKAWDINLAAGYGISYANKVPEFELMRTGGNTDKLLSYLMFELETGLPAFTNFSLFTRIHHRSGTFGLYSGVTGASNAWALGVRYRF
jgi:hypothetical protein